MIEGTIENAIPDLVFDNGSGIIYVGWLRSRIRTDKDLTDCLIRQVVEEQSGNTSIKYPFGICASNFDWNAKEEYPYQFLKH